MSRDALAVLEHCLVIVGIVNHVTNLVTFVQINGPTIADPSFAIAVGFLLSFVAS